MSNHGTAVCGGITQHHPHGRVIARILLAAYRTIHAGIFKPIYETRAQQKMIEA